MNPAADSRRNSRSSISFIHAYTLVNGRPPAEADLMRFFERSPDGAFSLENAGLISRKPGVPRSIVVLLESAALPELTPGDAQPVKTTVTRY